jgi:hypothetical protein
MTRQRIDNHSTEFGIWIRKQADIDSYKGYRNYNLDIIWWRKKGWSQTPEYWMLIEEKRYMSPVKGDQLLTFRWLHEKLILLNDPTYKGFYILQFENTNPDDGKIFLDEKEITKEQLIKFLKFEEYG